MPDYDDTFLYDCEKFNKKHWRSYSLNRHPKLINELSPIRNFFKISNGYDEKRRSFYGILKEDVYYENQCDSGSSTPCGSIERSSGHKNSLRGTKLARRARSFKDDFLEKISQIRTPTNTMTRSHSPNSPRSGALTGTSRASKGASTDETIKPQQDLDYHVRQVKHALTHFKDVICKNKLEMLPGNGTVVLDMISNVHVALQSYTLNENSNSLISATKQVHLSLGKLIKFCDEILLNEEENSASLSKENVKEIVDLVENAVNNLVKLANEKMLEREAGAHNEQNTKTTCNTLQRPAIDVAGQRTSLPDIHLTPRELDTLEKTSMKTVRASHSTESILRDTSPPPKPPLPSNRQSIGSGNSGGGSSQLCSGNDDDMLDDNLVDDRINPNPPPLPPKRRSNVSSARQNNTNNFSINSADSDCIINDNSFLTCGLERMSMRSRSPEDNSSLLSASAGSLDSALNHSREEDELRALTHDHSSIDDQILTNDLDKINPSHAVSSTNSTNINNVSNRWADESETGEIIAMAGITQLDGLNHRHSNESGFVSMHSVRSSVVSTTKRTSQQQTKITNFSSTTSSSIQKSESILESLSEQQQTQITSSSSSTVKIGQKQVLREELFKQNNSEHEKTSLHKTIGNFTSAISKTDSFDFNNDDVFDGSLSELGPGDLPPALPVKQRRRSSKREPRHVSTYDNVEDTEINEQNTQDQHLPLRFPSHAQSLLNRQQNMSSKHQSLIEPRHMKSFDGEQPPPLPMKKKHIMAYMEIFGNCSHSPQSASEFLRHSVHTYNLSHSSDNHQHHHSQQISHSVISHSQTMSLSPLRNQIQTMQSPPDSPTILDKPPALPPKRVRGNSRTTTPPYIITTPPPSPKILNNSQSAVQSVVPTIINDHQDQISSPSLNNNDSCHNSNNTKNNSISNSNIPVSPSSQKKVLNSNQVITISSSSLSSATGQPNVTKTVVIPAISSISNNIISSTTTTTTTNATPNIAMSYPNNIYDNDKDDDKENYLHLCDTTTIISPNATTTQTTTTTGIPATSNGTQQQNNLNLLTKHNHILNNNINDNNNSNHNNNNNNNNSLDMIDDDDEVEVVLRRNISANKTGDKNGIVTKSPKQPDTVIPEPNLNLIEEIDVTKYLVIKKESEDGPDVKGGHPDALIIHATRRSDNAYGEAFITTFRTFISPYELIEKLIHRYNVYSIQIMSNEKQRAAKESFSLLVRVVYDLTTPDLTTRLIDFISDFVYHLVCAGQLVMARLLRVKLLEKALLYKQQKMPAPNATLSSRAVIAQPPTLLDLKPSEIAEQMTLLDAELFEKIEIPEVLIWAQEQCEERSPNLTRFTEHFNKMSYWARSQILKQEDAKDREKYVIKFIKIMKHLRKINNYNSYLALLSALDSAPIRRLDWHNQKQITEGLKEYCALIDSSSSFRAYRQALAETNPPCIPYIGLVLQDLTFVHIGNQNNLSDNNINFSKRWQQYNIVVNMKRFKKCSYPFKKNEKIIGFFDNFENYLDEDAMWQISENIKPRGSGKRQVAN